MRWMITGATGSLGRYLLRYLRGQGDPVVGFARSGSGSIDGAALARGCLTDSAYLRKVVGESEPHAIVHLGASAGLAACAREPEQARAVNVGATQTLARLAAEHGCRLVFTSTDMVFSGRAAPYREEHSPDPQTTYGRTKAEAEEAVRACPDHAIVRLPLMYGPALDGSRPTFFDQTVERLQKRETVSLFHDEWRSPLSLEDAARGLADLARSPFQGVVHFGGPDRLSRLEMGRIVAEELGFSTRELHPASRREAASPEPRPEDLTLADDLWRKHFPSSPRHSLRENLAPR